jgi:hypothetical protein
MATLVAGLALGGLAQGATTEYFTWNTCEGGGDQKCVSGYQESSRTPDGSTTGTVGSIGEVIEFTALESTSTVLSASAYWTSRYGGAGPLNSTKISIWDGGLGAGGESGSPNHAVDNMGYDEYLVFDSGSTDTFWESFKIGWSHSNSGEGRPEITVLAGDNLTGLLSGWPTTPADWSSKDFPNVSQLFDNVIDLMGRYLLIGVTPETAATTVTTSRCCTTCCVSDKDAFKVLQVVASRDGSPPSNVPEPATVLLMGLGLAGIGAARRRRLVA